MKTDKELFAGNGARLTPEESERKMKLMSNRNSVDMSLHYRSDDYTPMAKIVLPSDNYEHYE